MRHKTRRTELGSAALLQALLGADAGANEAWSPADLRAILEHEFDTPLVEEGEHLLQFAPEKERDRTRQVLMGLGRKTVHDLLRDRDAPLTVLRLVKDSAKASLQTGADLPRDVARALYLAVLVHAVRASIDDLTRLSAREIEQQVRLMLTAAWLPERARKLLRL